MTNLGDINENTYEDIAIGAPYEESGVVYIYTGSERGIFEPPSQVILYQMKLNHDQLFLNEVIHRLYVEKIIHFYQDLDTLWAVDQTMPLVST